MSTSDTLFDTERSLNECCVDPYTNDETRLKINQIRCQMVALRLELDSSIPMEWLERNPIYAAAKNGDIGPHDAYMNGDDRILLPFSIALAKAFPQP
ncbi:hypothetical protein [Brucella rhizosphaerae]|nr:hypothetical protein [Brucella rhizosphaerae]